jgi:hypothetical protein
MTMAEELDHAGSSSHVAANLRFDGAEELFEQIPEIAEDMGNAPKKDEASLAFMRRLLEAGTPEEAITFAAYALVPRHAVWWGHECLNAQPDSLTEQDREMLALCAAWAADPNDDTRYGAMDAAENATTRGPGVWLAMGAGWSEGSMAGPDQPEVPPPLFLAGRAVNAAVLSFLARCPQDKRRRMIGHFVSMAEYLAKSG